MSSAMRLYRCALSTQLAKLFEKGTLFMFTVFTGFTPTQLHQLSQIDRYPNQAVILQSTSPLGATWLDIYYEDHSVFAAIEDNMALATSVNHTGAGDVGKRQVVEGTIPELGVLAQAALGELDDGATEDAVVAETRFDGDEDTDGSQGLFGDNADSIANFFKSSHKEEVHE